MFHVKDNATFKLGYELLKMLLTNERNNIAMNDNLIPQLKKELRFWAHKDNAVDVGMGFMVNRRIVKDCGIDGYVELVSIPDVFNNEKDADEFFMDFIHIGIIPSQYDCTGQPFTSWYKLFRRNGQFFAYHRISFDV